MMSKERASLGFGDDLDDFDPATWPKTKVTPLKDRPRPDVTKQAAEAAGFRSREPAAPKVPTPIRRQRRRRTGRNVQLNIKTTPEAVEAFTRIADSHGWGLGETLERAIELLDVTPGKIKS